VVDVVEPAASGRSGGRRACCHARTARSPGARYGAGVRANVSTRSLSPGLRCGTGAKSDKMGRMLLHSSPRALAAAEDDDAPSGRGTLTSSSPIRRYDWMDLGDGGGASAAGPAAAANARGAGNAAPISTPGSAAQAAPRSTVATSTSIAYVAPHVSGRLTRAVR
jgi:hypothetical protein